ncbi:hypothetical protein QR680_004306 [Steinernema hermaphroditum]|uniref:Uncharacterized protein n=1 Tax=Steinernema hermaphroditum TaxID=289476 RepID=A0AA39HN98_9BILA|nr:hypothetical protein QR680_004306 [Steinernema hermaphroditum]
MVPEIAVPVVTVIELVFDVIAPFFNFYLLFLLRKQIFHVNLRILTANFAIALIILTVTRIILTIYALFSIPFSDGFLTPIGVIHDMCVNTMMSIALPMVVERIAATAMVYRYERTSCPWVPLMAISALWAANAFDCLHAKDIMSNIFADKGSIGDKIHMATSTSILITINAVSVALFLILIVYNTRRFQRKYGVYSLTQRYQMAENIRTSRQLLKVIFINFVVDIFSATIILMNVYWNEVELNKLLSQIFDLTCALAAIVIPTVTILSHPKLSMENEANFASLCKKISCWKASANEEQVGRVPLQTVGSKKLIVSAKEERDVYFNQLSLTWK